jgi:hypothetical protein
MPGPLSPSLLQGLAALVEQVGEDLVVPLISALLRRDLSAAERHARAITETDTGIAILKATPGSR